MTQQNKYFHLLSESLHCSSCASLIVKEEINIKITLDLKQRWKPF